MLQWRPEDRGDAEAVYFDGWLLSDTLAESGITLEELRAKSLVEDVD